MNLSTEEIQRRVKENFQKILDKHDAHGLPVVIMQDDKIFYLYKDGRKIETERSKKRSQDNSLP